MTQRFEEFMQKRENPAFLVKFDEFAFSTGILTILVTFSLVFYPDVRVLAAWTTILNSLLIYLRFREYKSKSWHYYYFDYCYFVNIASWIYLWLFPSSIHGFFMVCVNVFSPMLNYFLIFRPRLIYH